MIVYETCILISPTLWKWYLLCDCLWIIYNDINSPFGNVIFYPIKFYNYFSVRIFQNIIDKSYFLVDEGSLEWCLSFEIAAPVLVFQTGRYHTPSNTTSTLGTDQICWRVWQCFCKFKWYTSVIHMYVYVEVYHIMQTV
jgi:hypothetical protein